MKITTLKTKLSQASERLNNYNAKKYLNSVIERFNNSQEKFSCSYIGEIANFAWCEVSITRNSDDTNIETIRVSLP